MESVLDVFMTTLSKIDIETTLSTNNSTVHMFAEGARSGGPFERLFDGIRIQELCNPLRSH